MTDPKQFLSKYRTNLMLLALVSLLGYAVFWLWFPLRPFYNVVPLQDVRSFAPSFLAGVGYGSLLLALFGLYWLAFRAVQAARATPSLLFLLGTAVLFAIPLLNSYPINAIDVYLYIINGRVDSIYNENPYAVPPSTFPDDPFLPLAGEWGGETTPYGPLWGLLATAVTGVTKDNLFAGLFSFKLIGLLAHVSCGWLIWQILARANPARQRSFTLLWLWNPALLLMFVVDGHNDVLMMVWQLLGIWFWRQKRLLPTIFFLLLATLTKPIALLVIPFFALAALRELPNSAARLRFVGISAVLGGTAVWLSFLPFGSPFDLVDRLLREASNNPGFSLATLPLLVAGELGKPVSFDLVANLFRIPFGVLILWLLWGVVGNGRSPLRAAASILFAYSLQALSFRLWYSTWPFLWLLLEDETSNGVPSYRLRAGLTFLLTTQLSVLIYGHLRAYALNGNQLVAHLIAVPFVFFLPILLAYYVNRKGMNDRLTNYSSEMSSRV